MSARTYDLRPSMFSVERIKLPQRQASKVKVPVKVREASIELRASYLLR